MLPDYLQTKNLNTARHLLLNRPGTDLFRTMCNIRDSNPDSDFITQKFDGVDFDAGVAIYAMMKNKPSLTSAAEEIFGNRSFYGCEFKWCEIGYFDLADMSPFPFIACSFEHCYFPNKFYEDHTSSNVYGRCDLPALTNGSYFECRDRSKEGWFSRKASNHYWKKYVNRYLRLDEMLWNEYLSIK